MTMARSRRVDGTEHTFFLCEVCVSVFFSFLFLPPPVYTTTPVKPLLLSLYNHARANCG